jgi:hypothetical protein
MQRYVKYLSNPKHLREIQGKVENAANAAAASNTPNFPKEFGVAARRQESEAR